MNVSAPFALLLVTVAGSASAAAGDRSAFPCASLSDTQRVHDYYTGYRPGVPLPVPSRFLDVPESVIASGLPAEQSIGTAATPELVKRVWKSIDAWGEKTAVKLVLTSGGRHAFAFPSLVPITQPDDKSGYLDVYADGGKGVHAHLQLERVSAIYASDIPGKEDGKRTRAISFFGEDGQLVLGVYASIAKEAADPAAIAGFSQTWKLIASLPRMCAKR